MLKTDRIDNRVTLPLLRTMPGIGRILSLLMQEEGAGGAGAKIGRTVYHLLRKQQSFDAKRFFGS